MAGSTRLSRYAAAWLLAAVPAGASDAPPPAVVAVVLDSSGSLSASDLERARLLARDTLVSLPPASRVAVFAFDDESRLLQEATDDVGLVEAAVAGLRRAGRFTALHDALYDASRYLVDRPGERRAIVLITDGKDENSAVLLEDGLELAREHAIPVFAVGVGRVQEAELRRVAKLTGGEYAPAAETEGAALAARIAALEPLSPAPEPTLVPVAPTPAGVPAAAPAPAASRPWLAWLLLVSGLALAGGAVAAARRSRRQRRCGRCGSTLARAGAPCPRCAPPVTSARAAPRPDDEAGATLLTRSPVAGDRVERTVVLASRPRLVFVAGPETGREHELSMTVATSIGRAPGNDIVVTDDAVSGQHCRVRPEAGRWVLYDLDSTNGTWLGERRVGRHPLVEGEVVRIGETAFEFRQFGPTR